MNTTLPSSCRLCRTLTTLLATGLLSAAAHAEISSTGDVSPDPNTSTDTTTLYLGQSAPGSLTIDNDSDLITQTTYIGFGNIAQATVDGVGSSWTNSDTIGLNPNCSLSITNGALVTTRSLSLYPNNNSYVFFDDGYLTLKRLYSSTNSLTGTGTINASGWTFDHDVTFDATNDPSLPTQFVLNDQPGQNINVNLLIDSSGGVIIGYADTAHMTIRDGMVLHTFSGLLGGQYGSNGSVTIEGPGSQWANTTSMHIGHGGTGSMTVSSGGSLTCSSLDIGGSGHGSLTIGDGGSVTCSSALTISQYGPASFTIADGGSVTCRDAYIEPYSGGSATIDVHGAGSMWTITGQLTKIGGSGSVSMNISQGGLVQAPATHAYAIISAGKGTTSRITVDGSGSKWLPGGFTLSAAAEGFAELQITNGGYVLSDGVTIAGNYGGPSSVTVDGPGSLCEVSTYETFIAGDSFATSPTATLNISHGGQWTCPAGIFLFYSAQINLDAGTITGNTSIGDIKGSLIGSGTIIGNLTSNGQISPGHSPGSLLIDGNLILQPKNTLVIDILGINPGQYDVLQVTGNATLAGNLEIRLLNGLDVSLINSLPWLVVAGSTTGSFTNITITSVEIPEPASLALLTLISLASLQRRRCR